MSWGNNGAGPQSQPANANFPVFYNASFESIYAAMCRGEIPANINMPAGALGPNPTLLQAMSQGLQKNGNNVNGGSIDSGPTNGANGTSFGGTQVVDAKQMASAVTEANPIQYSGG